MSDDKEIPDVIFTEKGCDKWSVIEQTWAIPNNRTRYISYTKTSTANQMVADALEEAWKLIRNNYGFESYSRAGEIFRALREKHKGE